jgi:hypothetical protein
MLKTLTIFATALALAACGGGGGGSSSSSTPAPAPAVSAAGVWTGLALPSGYELNLVVMPDNKLYSIFGTPISGGLGIIGADFGSVTASGNSFAGTFTEYFFDNTSLTGSLNGSVVANTSLSGTTVYSDGSRGSFALAPLKLNGYNFNTPAILSDITGTWVGQLLIGVSATVTIQANGSLSGSGAGCTFTGKIAPDPSGVNVFATTITYGSGCPSVGLVETGISLSYLTTSGSRQFISMVSSASTGGAFFSSTLMPLPVTPPTLNLNSAWYALGLTNSSSNFTFSGVLDGLALSGSGTSLLSNVSPVSVQVFDPQNPFFNKNTITNLTKVTRVASGTLIVNGSSNLISSTEDVYVNSSGVYIAINDVDDSEQTLITSFTPLPSSVTAGTSGTFYTGTVYSRLGYTCGTATSSFAVASETNTSLLVTFTDLVNTTQQAVGQCSTNRITTQTIYRLTASGLAPVKSTGSSSQTTGSVIQTF